MRPLALFPLAFLCSIYISATSATLACYWPNGGVDTGSVPCNQTTTVSACCSPGDSCSATGLCLGSAGYPYRGSCTDQTWASPACSKLCLQGMLLLRRIGREMASSGTSG